MMFDSIAFMEMVKQLNEANRWLESLGITRKERFEQIKLNVEELAIEYGRATANQKFSTDKNKEFQNGIFEAQPFISIYKSFKDCTDREFLRLLKVAVRGPEFSADENANENEHRNHLFALALASKLKDRGLVIKHFSDIVIDFEGHDIAIQCKRPYSLERLGGNIEGAYGQFHTENHMTADNNVKGIIAVSVEKILELDEHSFVFNTRTDIEKYLKTETQKLYDTHRTKWDYLRNKNVLAIFFYFRLVSEIKDENNMVYSIDSPVVNLMIKKDHPDAQLLANFAKLLV